MNIFMRVNEKKAFRINISYLIGRPSTMLLYVKGKKKHMFSACSIFIINACLWKTLQVTLLFLLMHVYVFIHRNDYLFMRMYKYKRNNKTRCPRCNAGHERARTIPRDVVNILLEERYILIHNLVKMLA